MHKALPAGVWKGGQHALINKPRQRLHGLHQPVPLVCKTQRVKRIYGGNELLLHRELLEVDSYLLERLAELQPIEEDLTRVCRRVFQRRQRGLHELTTGSGGPHWALFAKAS
jgi:hypothetical protein